MVNHFNEKNRRDLGIVWLIAGLIFIFSGFSGGTVFLVLGVVWLASSDGKGLSLFRDKPDDMRTLLKGTTIGLLVLASVVLVANAIP
jgi:asparagine N-glycosylation enzyme membrane subunit Stt3